MHRLCNVNGTIEALVDRTAAGNRRPQREAWAPHVASGGYLAIHDIFPDPNDGGQAPYEIYRLALASGEFEEREMIKTLGVLQRC